MNRLKARLLGGIFLGALLNVTPSYAMDIELLKKGTKDSFLSLKEKILAPLNMGVNARDEYGKTPLMRALENTTDLKELSALLSHPDIDVNAQDNQQDTILRQALQRPTSLEAIEMLLAHSNIDIKPNWLGKTALMWCVSQPYPQRKVVNRLLKHSEIDVNAQDWRGKTALIYAVSHSNASSGVVDELLDDPHIDISLRDEEEGQTALMFSVSNSFKLAASELIVKKLLRHPDIDVNLQKTDGNSAIDFASSKTKKIIEEFTEFKKWRNAEFFLEEEHGPSRNQTPSYISFLPDGVKEETLSYVIGTKYTKEGHEKYKQKKRLEEEKQKLTPQQRNILERHVLYGLNSKEKDDVYLYVERKRKEIAQAIAQNQKSQ